MLTLSLTLRPPTETYKKGTCDPKVKKLLCIPPVPVKTEEGGIHNELFPGNSAELPNVLSVPNVLSQHRWRLEDDVEAPDAQVPKVWGVSWVGCRG